jgi:2-beta-glucuronyltransferase
MTLPMAAMDSPAIAEPNETAENYLVISAHDYRSPRKAGIHFVTDELKKRGATRFFSLRYSKLSKYTEDPRLSLDALANKLTHHDGVECYLWKTLIHPVNTRRSWLRAPESLVYSWYARGDNDIFKKWVREATVILLESGISPIFFDTIKKLNPQAKIVYRVSDTLDAINAGHFVTKTFARVAPQIDTVVLISKHLADSVPSDHNLAYCPQGIDPALMNEGDPSPYQGGKHAVSVGSMLFDPNFFVIASKLFPEVHFHIIGSGHGRHSDYGDNVSVYGEMPFALTLRYIKHADFGIAPYYSNALPVYLRETSLKLIQYDFFRVPAVCPEFIAADYAGRFGYTIGDKKSIEQAITLALTTPRTTGSLPHLNWNEVVDRMLAPQKYSDTEVTA